MRITSQATQMQSQFEKISYHEKSESMTVWKNGGNVQIPAQDQAQFGEEVRAKNALPNDNGLSVGEATQFAQAIDGMTSLANIESGVPEVAEAKPEKSFAETVDEIFNDLRTHLLKAMVDELKGAEEGGKCATGQGCDAEESTKLIDKLEGLIGKIRSMFGGGEGSGIPDWGMQYEYHEVHYEKETVEFRAAGRVTTADGREISFSAEMFMSRETMSSTDISIKAGAALIDPLALNFDGRGVKLSDDKVEFDIDSDGQKDSVHRLGSGSGYLAIDKNGNGKIDDGRELFGPESGNGFNELSMYDDDGNGWIDENDSVFTRLVLMQQNKDGSQSVHSIADKGVGAIALNRADTRFDLQDSTYTQTGRLAETGVFLLESGQANLVQEIDLSV